MVCADPSPIFEFPEGPQEDMANLTKQDKEWISRQLKQDVDDAIANVIADFKPHGLRRIAHFIKEWSLLGVLIGALLALLSLAGSGWYYAFSRVAKEASFETSTTDTLTGINDHLKEIDSTLSLLQIQQAAANPTDKSSVEAVRKTLVTAQRSAVKLPIGTIEQAGQKFLDSSDKSSTAWGAALDFLRYRSFLNSDFQIPNAASMSSASIPSASRSWAFKIPSIIPGGVGRGSFGIEASSTLVPASSAARLERIGKPLNAGHTAGPPELVLSSHSPQVTLVIDGFLIKNVEFKGFKIIYNGGPLMMDNVLFVDCTFEMQPQQNGRDLASAILSASTGASINLATQS